MVENPLQLHKKAPLPSTGLGASGEFSKIPSMCFPQFGIYPFACLCSRGYTRVLGR